ncbi:MAG: hypothetical protein Aurels2KO_42720 [Aureliella sp.]
MTENPFRASPQVVEAGQAVATAGRGARQEFFEIARETFWAWEKLRVAYLLVLGLPCLLGMLMLGLFTPGAIVGLVFCGLFANACYFAGPIVETYVRWLGYSGMLLRWVLFVGGTMLTAILALVAIRAL